MFFVLVEASKHSCSSCVLVAIEYKLVVEPHPRINPCYGFAEKWAILAVKRNLFNRNCPVLNGKSVGLGLWLGLGLGLVGLLVIIIYTVKVNVTCYKK